MTTATTGDNVSVHYRGTLTDGTEFDNSYSRGTPIEFEIGSGQMISGFSDAIVGMAVGDKKTISLTSSEAYGEINPEASTSIPRTSFPAEVELTEGMPVPLATSDGRHLLGRVSEVDTETVTVDLNHPLAGKALQFEVELMGVGTTTTTPEEDTTT